MEGETWLSALLNKGPRSTLADCIFYGVPKDLKKVNEEAYAPQAVSIGPLHYGKPHLRPMEPKKELYLKCFFDRTTADRGYYYKLAKQWEVVARAYYQGNTVNLNPDELVKMLLVDGIFVIEFFLGMCINKGSDQHDDIFKTDLLRDDIFHDMVILLENQLPFVVLSHLYSPSYNDLQWEEFVFLIAREWFKKGVSFEKVKETLKRGDIRHLAGFLHALCVVSIPVEKSKRKVRQKFELSRSAIELREAGVQFIVPLDRLPFDLKFTEGTLEFPPLIVDRWTELSFRNFIAHEHCLHKDKIISSYIILMGSLLKTAKDVDILVEQKIIDNRSLGSSEDVCNLLKNLYSRSMMDKSEFYYPSLCDSLNEYSKDVLLAPVEGSMLQVERNVET